MFSASIFCCKFNISLWRAASLTSLIVLEMQLISVLHFDMKIQDQLFLDKSLIVIAPAAFKSLWKL